MSQLKAVIIRAERIIVGLTAGSRFPKTRSIRLASPVLVGEFPPDIRTVCVDSSMNGVDPPRGFAFAWFKIGNENIGIYSVHLKSNLITHGDVEAETAKNIQKREVAVT